MAKDVQTRMEGTFDEPIAELQEKAEEYADQLRQRMQDQEVENQLRQELIELMKKHDRDVCNLDGKQITLEHIESDKIRVKTRKETDDE